MESIYYVVCWHCHRACPHCYESRFHPYTGEALDAVLEQSHASFPKIIDHLPSRMTYLDLNDPGSTGTFPEKIGQLILAGGEVLSDPVRETILYPALERAWRKYEPQGGVRLVVQTTGDLVTPSIVAELLERHVWMISVSGIDAFHVGLESRDAQDALVAKLTRIFEAAGMTRDLGDVASPSRRLDERTHYFHFFGATPEQWIGRLWPRGRAQSSERSTATIADNFCNRWSGGLNFLQHRYSGSEVSIEPDGNVYPCCAKSSLPIGNLTQEPLEAILDRLVGDPVYEAISMGHPERMGIAHGWGVDRFLKESAVTLASGRIYQNLCIGCDRFHQVVLAPRRRRAGR